MFVINFRPVSAAPQVWLLEEELRRNLEYALLDIPDVWYVVEFFTSFPTDCLIRVKEARHIPAIIAALLEIDFKVTDIGNRYLCVESVFAEGY